MLKNWQPPTLSSERLILRSIVPDDIPAIYAYACKPSVAKYMPWNPHECIKDTEKFYYNYIVVNYKNQIYDSWGISLKGQVHCIIGTICCRPVKKIEACDIYEIGYTLDNTYWGRGLIVEAAKSMINYMVRRYNIHQIVGTYKSGNDQSKRVFEKLGFKEYPLLNEVNPIQENNYIRHGMSLIVQ